MYHARKSLIFLILLLLIRISTPRDTITTGQELKDGEMLVSANGTFALGFFSPGISKNRYIGIWYNKVSESKIVWVANRDSPVNNTSGVLSFENSGNLVIYGAGLEVPVWSTNFSDSGNNHSAQLLDIGNFVVFGNYINRRISWQSFDHPTDTMLPMMKLGANRKSGLSWSLTSWKSLDDPGTGEYSYRMNLGEYSEMFLYRGSSRVWRTGPWNGVRLSGVPEMSSNFIFNITNVDNEDEVSVMYGMRDPLVYSIMVVNQSGVMERMTWHPDKRQWIVFWSAPKDPCDYYGHCGPNGNCDSTTAGGFECSCFPGFEPKSPRDWYLRDGSEGCVRKRDHNVCQKGEGFVKLSGTKIPETSKARVNRSLGLKECEAECLRDCKCTGYANANVSEVGSGCVIWYGDLMDTREFQSGGGDLFIRVDAVELAQYLKTQNSSSKKGKVAAAVVASVGTVAFLTVFLLCRLTKKRKEKRRHGKFVFSSNTSIPSSMSLKGQQFDESETSPDLPFFDLSTLAEATDSFSIENMLGQGGFGSVYKGTLKSGQEIAVKRLSKSSGQGADEFKNEASLIAKLQHRNLVRLLGYCVQQEEKILIYEYLPNKSLDFLIFDNTRSSCLDWSQRFSIIMGITRGMVYLHHDSRLRIVHRDLKASNVLLDAAMLPKISDFGMARIFGGDQIEANTNRVVGTYGYMSPEYAMEGIFSTKSDVFSFGVLLLEIISGRKNTNHYQDSSVNLIGHVWDLWREERALEIVDSSLGGSYSAKEVLRCIHVGLLSVQEQAIDRPTMSEVAFMLSNETALPPPRQAAFISKKLRDQYSSSASVGAQSVNDISVSVINAR